MNIWILLLLCITQGLTEFLPISSSGHLLLIEQFFNINDNNLLINLFLHLATLFAVMIFYRKIILKLLKKPFQPLTFKLLISTIFSVVIALIYTHLNLDTYFEKYLGFCFIVTSIILFSTHIFQQKSITLKCGDISYTNSVFVGIIQGIAVIPGISRSGSTISTLILLGNEKEKSSEYSFLLSIPIIIGGFILEIAKINNFNTILSNFSVFYIIIAFFITFITALLSLKITIKLLNNNKFIYFSIYLFIIGFVTIFIL